MKKLIYDIQTIILCIIIWVVLNENTSIYQIVLGGVLGLAAAYLTNNVLTHDYTVKYRIQPLLLFKYFIFVIIKIYISGISTIIKIISGNINPGIVEIETELVNDLYICFLANSITLTPGTVVVEKKGSTLKVLWIDCITKDKQKAGDIIKGEFEKILLKG